MEDKKEYFRKFSDNRLIEIVKNARQFGYDDTIRNNALDVLKERGISQEDLQLTGNLTNDKFDSVEYLYKSYTTNSNIAFIIYGVLLLLNAITLFWMADPGALPGLFSLVLFITFFVFFILSFFNHLNFYRSIGKEMGVGDQMMYFLVGMPFYFFMHFSYKSQMREEMKMVH